MLKYIITNIIKDIIATYININYVYADQGPLRFSNKNSVRISHLSHA
jgi:hypothetical protein